MAKNVIRPPKQNISKEKKSWKNDNEINAIVSASLVTPDNFFVATIGEFKEIDEVPEGYKVISSKNRSKYYTDSEERFLVRKSDHWGHNIGSCCWYLIGHERKEACDWRKGVKIGIVLFRDLKPIR